MTYTFETVDRDPETEHVPHVEYGRAPLRIVDDTATEPYNRLIGYIYRPDLVAAVLDALNAPQQARPSVTPVPISHVRYRDEGGTYHHGVDNA